MTHLPTRFRRTASVLRALCFLAIAGFMASGAVVLWSTLSGGNMEVLGISAGTFDNGPAMTLAAAWVLFATAANIAVLWFTARLLGVYANADPLSDTAARLIRCIATALLAKAVVAILSPTVLSLIESIAAQPGARRLVISVGDIEVGLLLAAALIWIIGAAMSEAARAEAENRGFV